MLFKRHYTSSFCCEPSVCTSVERTALCPEETITTGSFAAFECADAEVERFERATSAPWLRCSSAAELHSLGVFIPFGWRAVRPTGWIARLETCSGETNWPTAPRGNSAS